VFKFDFAGVQIFGSEKSKILKPFQAQQRGMERTIEVKDSFVNVEFLNLRSPGGAVHSRSLETGKR
jgi:hypothetical protein